MRKLSNERGAEIVEQGRRQFMAMFDEFACPYDEKNHEVERKLWFRGYTEAKLKWFQPIDEKKRRQAEKRKGRIR